MCRSCCGLFPALHVPSIKSVQSPAHTRNKKKQTKQTNETNKQTDQQTKQNTELSKNGSFSKPWTCHWRETQAGGKAPLRPFLAALRYRYLPPCSTAGRPCTGRAPVLLWSATPCWLWLAGCGLQRLSSCCKTSTTVCGHGTHLRIFLCVSVCVVSLISALPRRHVHAVHAFSDWTPCQSNVLCVHHFCGGSHNTRMHSTHDWSLLSRLLA